MRVRWRSAQQQEKPKTQTVTGVVSDIRTAVKGGDSFYYVKLDKGASYYAVKASDAEAVVILNKGDTVTVTIPTDAKGDIIDASEIVKGRAGRAAKRHNGIRKF